MFTSFLRRFTRISTRLPLGDIDRSPESAPSLFERTDSARGASYYLDNAPVFMRWASISLVTFPILFSLWVLRAERYPVAYPNDSGMHLQMSAFASYLLHHGIAPLDHWYPFLSLGSPFFVDYQSFSAIITGFIGQYLGMAQVYAWSIYLLLALWPLCVYWSGRLMGWSKLIAAFAAFFAPLLFSFHGHGFEYKSYLWVGNGLWSQMWAMWTLPLAWGFGWRYIEKRRDFFWALLFLSLTIIFHFLTAYMAVLGIAVWVLIDPRRLVQRLTRAGVLGLAVGLATAWMTVPLLVQGKWLAVNQFQLGTTINNSYGGGQVFSWLFHGDIYDTKRFPEITILVFIGAVICAVQARRDIRARGLLVLWGASLIFFSGRPTFSFILDLIPGNAGILFQRYIAEVEFTGLFLAGIGLVGVCRFSLQLLHDGLALNATKYGRSPALVATALTLLATICLSWFSLQEAANYAHRDAYWIAKQRNADATEGPGLNQLIALAEQRGGGRIYAGMPSNWGSRFTIGGVQVFIYLEQAGLTLQLPGIDAVGFTLRTSGTLTNPECYFDQYNPGDYTAFGIRYLLLPAGMKPPVPATLVASRGRFTLWHVANYGVMHVVQTSGVITANATTIGPRTVGFLQSSAINAKVYPLLSYDGQATASPTLAVGETAPADGGGVILGRRNNLVQGRASATVLLHHQSVIMLSAAYEPGWSVTVDGHPAPVEILAPSMVGVQVPVGKHRVVFTWSGYQHYLVLDAIAMVTFATAAYVTWRRRQEGLSVTH